MSRGGSDSDFARRRQWRASRALQRNEADASKLEAAKQCVDAAVNVGEATEKYARLGIAALLLLFFGLILPSPSAEEYLADWARTQGRVDVKTQRRDELRAQNKTRQLRSQAAIRRLTQLAKLNKFRAEFLSAQRMVASVTPSERMVGSSAANDFRVEQSRDRFQAEYERRIERIITRFPESRTALVEMQSMDAVELAEERKRLEQKGEAAEKRYDDQKRAIQAEIASLLAEQRAQSADAVVPLKVLGAFDLNLGPDEIKIPIIGLPVLWSVAICLLVFYVSQQRQVMLGLYARGIRILAPFDQTTTGSLLPPIAPPPLLKDSVAKLVGPLGSRFWWLAPLPEMSERAPDLRAALGWPQSRHQVPLACVLCSLAIGALQGAVVAASFGRAGIVDSGIVRHLVPAIVCCAATLTGFIVWRWLSGGNIPPLAASGADAFDRRRTLQLAAAMLAAGLLAGAVPGEAALPARNRTVEDDEGEREPRYRRRRQRPIVATILPTGFYRNPRTGVVHHVSSLTDPKQSDHVGSSANPAKLGSRVRQQPRRPRHSPPPASIHKAKPHTVPGPQCRPEGNAFRHADALPLLEMVPVNPSDVTLPHVNRLGASLAFELEALLLVRHADDGDASIEPCSGHAQKCRIDLAIDLLMRAIREAEVASLRIYDLLAMLAVRYERQDALAQLVATITTPDRDPAFKSRLRSWTSETSRFRRRAKQKKLQWAGYPLYDV